MSMPERRRPARGGAAHARKLGDRGVHHAGPGVAGAGGAGHGAPRPRPSGGVGTGVTSAGGGCAGRHETSIIRGRSDACRVLTDGDGSESAEMSKVCSVCAKSPTFGNNRSHSMRATPRRFNVNVQKVRILNGNTPVRVYVCTRCLKAGKVRKAG